MPKIPLIQLGVGQIGKTLIKQIIDGYHLIQKRTGTELTYCALADSEGFIINKDGLVKGQLEEVLKSKEEGGSVADLKQGARWDPPIEQVSELTSELAAGAIIVDVTDSADTSPFLLKGIKKNCGLALSNKIPLSSSYRLYGRLAQGTIRYETTVGAGLPVIDTLNKLMASGDRIVEIKGALSGTLNFIFSQMDKGESFSTSVKEAYELGYTEPDPREDLSGKDLARKALTLARTMGYKLELDNVQIHSLYPKEMEEMEVEKFMEELASLDDSFKGKFKTDSNEAACYLLIVKGGNVQTEVENLPQDNPFTTLKGPENLVSFTTKRYNKWPLYIRGPGAGPEVTAAGVLTDIMMLSTEL